MLSFLGKFQFITNEKMINLEYHSFLKPVNEVMNLGSDHQPLSKPSAEKMVNKSGSSTKWEAGDTQNEGPYFDPF